MVVVTTRNTAELAAVMVVVMDVITAEHRATEPSSALVISTTWLSVDMVADTVVVASAAGEAAAEVTAAGDVVAVTVVATATVATAA